MGQSHFSCVLLFVTLWTVAHQAPPSMEFSRTEYWSMLPPSSRGIFLTQGLNPCLLCLLYCWQILNAEPLGKPQSHKNRGSNEEVTEKNKNWLELARPKIEEGHGNPLQYSCLGISTDRRPGGLHSTGSQRFGHNCATNFHFQVQNGEKPNLP